MIAISRSVWKVSSSRAFICVATMAMIVGLNSRTAGEPLVGLTVQNVLVSFESATPGAIATIGPVTGLTAGDVLIGIDRRPSISSGPNNNRIYAVGKNQADGSGRIYTLDELTAAATLVSPLSADPNDEAPPTPYTGLTGSSFGIDFDPVSELLVINSDTGQNLFVNTESGLVTLNPPRNYSVFDPKFGDTPVVVALAHTRNFGGAGFTIQYGIDVGGNPDVQIFPGPIANSWASVSDLPFNASNLEVAYDISGNTGDGFIAIMPAASSISLLYRETASGVSLVGAVGGGVALRGLTAPVGPAFPEPTSLALFAAGMGLCVMRRRPRIHASRR